MIENLLWRKHTEIPHNTPEGIDLVPCRLLVWIDVRTNHVSWTCSRKDTLRIIHKGSADLRDLLPGHGAILLDSEIANQVGRKVDDIITKEFSRNGDIHNAGK